MEKGRNEGRRQGREGGREEQMKEGWRLERGAEDWKLRDVGEHTYGRKETERSAESESSKRRREIPKEIEWKKMGAWGNEVQP